MIRILSIIYIYLFLSLHLMAQEYRHYTISDGLSSTDVTAICENENFLWIATNDGLNRFDGKEFKVYKKDYEAKNSLSENNIEALMFDSKGMLWIGLKTGGADTYNPRKNTFTHISHYIKKFPQRVITIYEDSHHNIWLGTWGEGVYKLKPSGESYIVEQHYSEYIVSSIIEKPANKLWMGSYYGHLLYDLNTEQWSAFPSTDNAVTQMMDTGERNSLYFSVWEKGLFKLKWDDSLTEIEKKHIANTSENIYRIYPSSDNHTIYLGTWGNGIKSVNINLEDTKRSISTKPYPYIQASVILSMFRDQYENLWIGTYGSGLFCVNENNNWIETLKPINKNGFSPAYVLEHFQDNKILIGTQGDGLFLYDMKNQSLSPRHLKSQSSIFNKYILSFYNDQELLIVGSDDYGFHYAPLDNGKFPSTDLKPFHADFLNKVTSIYRDKRDKFWFGTKQSGLVSLRYNSERKTFTDYTHYNLLITSEITGFAESGDDQLWIFSHDGIYLFDSRLNKIVKQNDSFINEMIYSLVDDKKNQCFWLGTSVGLRRLNYTKDNKVENISIIEELPVGAIKDLILDSNNNLWFSVADRIFCYQESVKQLKEINIDTWGREQIYSSDKITLNGKEYIIFGGVEKLLKIDPLQALNQPDKNKILLTGLQIDFRKVNVGDEIYGDVVLTKETEYTESIALSYKCKWISLSFTEIGWNNYKNRYKYRIEGFSDDWLFLDISKPITFSQLSPGDYVVRIVQDGSNNSDKSSWSLKISITPPWWRTGWFYSLLGILILTIFVCILFFVKNYYKRRQVIRLKEIEKKKKEELLQEKELFFTGLSHDLLTPFSLIIAPVNDLLREKNITEDQTEKLEIVSKNASFLSNIFSTILDFKKVELYDSEIKEQSIEMVSFTQMAVNIFEYLAKSKNVILSFTSNVNGLFIKSDIVKLERILYNVISNALKYTNDGDKVEVLLRYNEGSTFTIDINDTGIGIAPESLNKIFTKFFQEKRTEGVGGLGLGLYITHKFVSALGGSVIINSELEKGTNIKIELPANIDTELIEDTDENTETEKIYSILLVEDNDQLRSYLKKKLSEHFDVAVASNGKDALSFIQKNLPEIVISDIMMPEMNGIELCSTIKNTPIFSDIFVILLSAKASIEDELKGYQSGADFYVKKPFDPDALIKQITNVYTTRQQRRKQILGELLSPGNENEIDPKDEFLQKAIKIVEKHLMNEDFKIDEFASEMNVSKSVLHRKFKMLLGETPIIFIRNIRLRKAANMLKETDLPVSEIAYTTGFSQSHYFIKCFKEIYNDTPKNYRTKNKKQ